MKKLWLFIFTVFCSAGLHNRLAAQSAEDTLKAARVVITASVTEYFPTLLLRTVNINLGREIYLKKRTTLHVNMGLVRSFGSSSGFFSVSSLGTKGMNVQVEKRYYLGKYKLFEPAILFFMPHVFQYKTQRLKNTGYYFSVHSLYQFTTTIRQFPGNNFQQQLYSVNRSIYGLHLKFGYQCIKKTGLAVDFAVGFGCRYIHSIAKNSPVLIEDRIINDLDFNNTSVWLPYPMVRFQLGWAFGVGKI